jgi:shikimate dehydrogenase
MATTEFAPPDSNEVFTLDSLSRISPSPTPYAVLGYPVAHSLSPSFQRAAFAKVGLAAQYHRVEIPAPQLGELVQKLIAGQFGGWNCTVPHKIVMYDLIRSLGHELSDAARALGSVNTVLNEGGRLTGFSTDGEGWLAAIREEFGVDVRDMRVMILGAGGAGRALAMQAALVKCERLVLVNRTFERARELADQLAPIIASDKLLGPRARLVALPWDEDLIAQEMPNIDLVVNATSCGLKSTDAPLLSSRVFTPSLLVYDTIYKPHRTKFLLNAEQSGARVANGLSMLLHQGAASFAIWTGRAAPIAEMRNALQLASQAS